MREEGRETERLDTERRCGGREGWWSRARQERERDRERERERERGENVRIRLMSFAPLCSFFDIEQCSDCGWSDAATNEAYMMKVRLFSRAR